MNIIAKKGNSRYEDLLESQYLVKIGRLDYRIRPGAYGFLSELLKLIRVVTRVTLVPRFISRDWEFFYGLNYQDQIYTRIASK